MDLSINEGTLVVTGGPGDSFQTAIVIRKTPKGLSAAGAEHLLIAQRHGQRGEGWTLTQQQFLKRNGRAYDVCRIALADGTHRAFHFDVTDWLDRVSASR
jgi:hypothetical protein